MNKFIKKLKEDETFTAEISVGTIILIALIALL